MSCMNTVPSPSGGISTIRAYPSAGGTTPATPLTLLLGGLRGALGGLRDQVRARALENDDRLKRLHLVRLTREHLHQVAARAQRDLGVEVHLGAVARQPVRLIEGLLHGDL